MEDRYLRNLPALSEAEQTLLGKKHVLLAGCGGLGGWLLEYLLRLGVGELTVADGDCFEESNLNRQLLSTPANLGTGKAAAATARAAEIRPDACVHAVAEKLTAENIQAFLSEADLVLDALDGVAGRLMLADACTAAGVPLVHGAVCGWVAQVSVVLPGSGSLHALYSAGEAKDTADAPEMKTCLAQTAGFCAALQMSEALKLLCGKDVSLAGKLLIADLKRMDFQTLEL